MKSSTVVVAVTVIVCVSSDRPPLLASKGDHIVVGKQGIRCVFQEDRVEQCRPGNGVRGNCSIGGVGQRRAEQVASLCRDNSGWQQCTTDIDGGCLLGDVQFTQGNLDVGKLCLDEIEVLVHPVSLHLKPLGIGQQACAVQREVAVAGVNIAFRTGQNEEPVTLNGQVRRTRTVRDTALREVLGNGSGRCTQTNLAGVRSAVR